MRKRMLMIAGLVVSGLALLTTGQGTVANSGESGTRLSTATYGDCTQCKVVTGCRICVGGGDANGCMTGTDCESCVELGICPPQGSRASRMREAGRSQPAIKLSAEQLREVAAVHPRFAATLARINTNGIVEHSYRAYWTPVEMTSADAERYINPNGLSQTRPPGLLAEVRRINQQIEQGSMSDIVYSVTVEEVDAATRILRIEVEKGSLLDPTYKALELKYTAARKSGIEWRVY